MLKNLLEGKFLSLQLNRNYEYIFNLQTLFKNITTYFFNGHGGIYGADVEHRPFPAVTGEIVNDKVCGVDPLVADVFECAAVEIVARPVAEHLVNIGDSFLLALASGTDVVGGHRQAEAVNCRRCSTVFGLGFSVGRPVGREREKPTTSLNCRHQLILYSNV